MEFPTTNQDEEQTQHPQKLSFTLEDKSSTKMKEEGFALAVTQPKNGKEKEGRMDCVTCIDIFFLVFVGVMFIAFIVWLTCFEKPSTRLTAPSPCNRGVFDDKWCCITQLNLPCTISRDQCLASCPIPKCHL